MFSLNSQNKKNISKMKKLRNHSQLKDEENSPEGTNNETDLCIRTDTKFKKKVMKILKELRMAIKSNADYFLIKTVSENLYGEEDLQNIEVTN